MKREKCGQQVPSLPTARVVMAAFGEIQIICDPFVGADPVAGAICRALAEGVDRQIMGKPSGILGDRKAQP